MPEQKKGDWLQDTIMFPVVEQLGEVSSYGDYANNGMVNVNMNFPQRQNYLYQVIIEYGRARGSAGGPCRHQPRRREGQGRGQRHARFENAIYFYGVAGLQNYGILTTRRSVASLTPATKAAGGTT